MKSLCFLVFFIAFIAPSFATSAQSSPSVSSVQPKPEESQLKADAKELIKASGSANDYSQLASDYAVDKQPIADTKNQDNEYAAESQPAYSQPLNSETYSQPLSYPQPLAYQPPQDEGHGQYQQNPSGPSVPGYEQPASASAAEAYSQDGQGEPQYSQQYPPSQQYQPAQPTYQPQQPSYQPIQSSYQPQQPSYPPAQPTYQSSAPYQSAQPSYGHSQGYPQPPYQPSNLPATSSGESQNYGSQQYGPPQISGYSQPIEVGYGQGPSSVPSHAYSEMTFTQTNADYSQQNGYQQTSAYSTHPIEPASYQPNSQESYSAPAPVKPKKTVILAIPVKLVSKNKYSQGNQENHNQEQPQYSHVQPAAAGIQVSHQNQDAPDNSGNAYYSSYPSQQGPGESYKQDKPIYNEKNESPRQGPSNYNEQNEKEVHHSPKQHIALVPISHNYLHSGPKGHPGNKPYGGRGGGLRKPYGEFHHGELSGPVDEESPVEVSHEHLSYGPGGELDPAALQTLSYLPTGKPGKPSDVYESALSGAPFSPELFAYGPHGPVHHGHTFGFSNPLELLYQPSNFGKPPFPSPPQSIPFGFGKPFGIRAPYGGSQASSSGSGSNYGQLLNSILSVYNLGGSKNGGKDASQAGSNKGIGSYFNGYGLDLLKGYSSITPNYLSSLYSSASSPTKMYMPPGPPKSLNMYPQQQPPQAKPKPSSGLMTSPSNIASAIEEMFKTSLNPVSKFRRPLYSDATKAITNFYKKLIN